MNPSEAWALLTIRSKSFDRQPGGYGSITTADVAALLGGLEGEPFLMGMAADCGDLNALREVELILWTRASAISEREGWEPPQGQFTVRRMAALAIYEAIDDRRCYACNGTQWMTFDLRSSPFMVLAPTFEAVSPMAGRIRCPACLGSGYIRLSNRKRADLAGINKDTWHRIWARRYSPIFDMANGWRESARQFLASRMRELESDKVDKPPRRDFSVIDCDKSKNTKQVRDSCASEKNHVETPRRVTAPERKSAPSAVEYGLLNRAILRLNR